MSECKEENCSRYIRADNKNGFCQQHKALGYTPEQKARRNNNSRKYYHADRDKYRERGRIYHDKHKERLNARSREWRANNYEKSIFGEARRRAKRFGLDFDLTIDDIVIPERCPILGMRLVPGSGNGGYPSSPSIDRIDPKLGYVKGNVWIISRKANVMKSDANKAELKSFAYWALSFCGGSSW